MSGPSQFISGIVGGDLSGALPNPEVSGVLGYPIAPTTLTSVEDGYVLTYRHDAGEMEFLPPSGGGGGSFTPGGDLSGSDINQTVVGIQTNPVQSGTLGPSEDGYVLSWNNVASELQFKPAPSGFTAGGDLSGTSTDQVVQSIQGVVISGTPSSGQVLTANTPTTATWSTPGGGGTTSQLLTSSGAFTIPPNVYNLSITMCGGGGGGGGGSGLNAIDGGGGGGGSGYFASGIFAVTPGDVHSYTIGAGGGGGAGGNPLDGADGTNGGTTSFSVLLTANGGSGGGGSVSGSGGAGNGSGGSGSDGSPQPGGTITQTNTITLYSGGAAGTNNGDVTGGGGGGAGVGGNGGAGGGDDGSGLNCTPGANGTGYGAGGGGGGGFYSDSGGDSTTGGNGGNGISGFIAVSW